MVANNGMVIHVEDVDQTAKELAAKVFGGLCAAGQIGFEQLTAEDDGVARMVLTIASVLKASFDPLHVS
jgi:hypothetical protein